MLMAEDVQQYTCHEMAKPGSFFNPSCAYSMLCLRGQPLASGEGSSGAGHPQTKCVFNSSALRGAGGEGCWLLSCLTLHFIYLFIYF